jgi:hypothetical protein
MIRAGAPNMGRICAYQHLVDQNDRFPNRLATPVFMIEKARLLVGGVAPSRS